LNDIDFYINLLNSLMVNAIAKMSKVSTNKMDVIEEIEKDTSISSEAKEKIISEVLNGRWFSAELDEYYGNKNLWVE